VEKVIHDIDVSLYYSSSGKLNTNLQNQKHEEKTQGTS